MSIEFGLANWACQVRDNIRVLNNKLKQAQDELETCLIELHWAEQTLADLEAAKLKLGYDP